ncbi:GNAT family N-acetyltransferase [Haloplanus halobius]|uniref:GNAT family N-acetyltransferase n=1 Tax=Haloplanus halobius TaxID=2934938 RepID=UPI00200C8F23|nr:GNAT family N-acetyltransferase [Haloplanus sp. XH21]
MVTVETPSPDEAGAVADLWVALARDQRRHGSHLRGEANYAAVRASMARHAADGSLTVARDEDGDLVGFVRYGIDSGPLTQDATRGVVRDLFVVPSRRREGVGGTLLDAAESCLRDRGAEVITLDAMARNDDAVRFYERRGYRPHRIEFELEVETDKRSRRDR